MKITQCPGCNATRGQRRAPLVAFLGLSIGVIWAVTLLSVRTGIGFFAEAKKQGFDFLQSDAARFAKIALTEDGQTVLSLVFDESNGLGSGFDRIYLLKNKDIKFFSKNSLSLASVLTRPER